VLVAVGHLLKSEVDIDALLGKLLDTIARAMDADRATLFVLDAQTGELYTRAAHLPELPEIRLKPGVGIAGHVLETGQPIRIDEPSHDERFFQGIDRRTGYHTRNLCAVPVRGPSGVIGVLEVLNKLHGDFAEPDVELLQALGTQVAEALLVSRLPQALGRYNRIVGRSAAMRAAYERIGRAAATDATVLIRGESGTGKELAARAIHVNSGRARGPFVKVDCTTIPAGLMESELFGHERGAFTGADRQVLGKCELAAGGTLFLDEIGDLPVALQGKLLRFVQDREVERIGGRKTLRVDARIVTATNRDLEGLVARGELRQDLYYRLRVVEILLPPLRDRGRVDIEALAQHFVELYARKHGRPAPRLTPPAQELLCAYAWPGNIRELEHCIESAIVLAGSEAIGPHHLALPRTAGLGAEGLTDGLPGGLTLGEVERRYIIRTLADCGGNRTHAARLLGIGRNTLQRKLREHGLS
jgi:Nif-specific regulatory protein